MDKPKIYGGKGGGGSSFVTKPDTLRSDDSFEILLGLGSGRWSGLVDGLQSVTINGVPLENSDGTSNFEGVFAVFADGDPLQDQIVDFTLGGGGNSQSVNTQLANDNPRGPGGWVSGAVNTPGADYIDLRFLVNQLFFQDDKSIRENTATIEIQMRPTGQSEWIDIFSAPVSNNTTYNQGGYSYDDGEGNFSRTLYLSRNYFNTSGQGFVASNSSGLTIRGKSTTPTVKELRVSVPNTGRYANVAWQVRARLLEIDTVSSTDDNPISQSRNITFETITAVISEPLGDDPEWDGLVWLQVYGAASDQFNGFPEIVAYCDTKVCQVPTANVFNPVTREYSSETWDGSFVEAFTTDPAWQIKEFIEDPIHGIAGLYPSARLDKWDALEASKYYSEQVPDGQGGTHPRFSMNLTITESREINDMMQYLAGAVNSYTEEIGEGLWRLKVDKPETPVMLFTEDNVFTEFQYSHSDIDTRFNDWRGTFLDASLDYEVNTVRVFDQDDIDLNGVKFSEVALVGCTNAQEALRRLMFRLRVSLNEFRSVSFETNRLGRLINPLDTILVADGGLNPNHLMKSTSRFASTSGNTITLLRELRLESGVSYKINLTTIDGEIIERSITNSGSRLGDVLELSINSPLPDNIVPESAVALVADNLAALPVQYRVLSVERVEESEDNYRITAIQIDTGKWAAMDNVSAQDIIAQETEIRIDSPTVPILGMFNVTEYSTDAQKKRVLQVNWQRPSGAFLGGYRLEYRLNDGQWIVGNENLSDSFYELQNPQDGTYDFRIFALDRRGVQSTPLIGRYTLDSDNEITPPAHLRGPGNTRPSSGAYNGFRFTTTDGDVPVTTVWNSTSREWQPESNLVVKGSDIGVADGATNNIGDLADLNAVTLGGPFVVGTLPSTKAAPELINTNITVNGSGVINGIGTANISVDNRLNDRIINLVEVGTGVVEGNSVSKTGNFGFNGGAYSREASTSFYVSFHYDFSTLTNRVSIGLSDEATPDGTDLDDLICHVQVDGVGDFMRFIVDGVGVGNFNVSTNAIPSSGIGTVVYEGQSCKLYVDGQLLAERLSQDVNAVVRALIIPHTAGDTAKLDNISYGPANNTSWDAITGTLPVSKADAALRNAELVPSIQAAASTAVYSNVLDAPTSLSDLDSAAGTKLGGIANNATRNIGALADLNVVDLAQNTKGTLPVSKADAALRNAELVPSIQAAASTAVYSNVLDAPTSLSELDATAGTKLGGIANNATRNIGALADKDTVNLGGSFVEGVLPTTKAADGLKNSVLIPSIASAAQTAQYSSVTGAPQALADLDNIASLKLNGIADNATNNRGFLADLDAIDLAQNTIGTLPVSKAVPELINENVPSVQNLRPFGDVTITGSSFKRNSGPSNDSAGVQHFERMNGGWKISARISIFNARIRLFGYPDFVPTDNSVGLTLPTHQIFYTGAGTIQIVGGHFSESNHSGIKVGDVISLEYTGTQYIVRLNGEIIANPRKGLGITPAENQKLIPTITMATNGGRVADISVESTGNNSFSALEGEGSPVPFASSNTFLTANHPDVILDTNRWTLSLQGINKGIATTQSNDGTFFEFRPSSARGTAYASLSDVVANSRNDLGRLYLRINGSGNGTTFLASNVWVEGVLKPFHGPIIKTTDRVGLGYDGANYFVTVNRVKVFQYPAPSSLSLTGYLFTSHPADVNTWIFEDITWDTYNNASFESLGGAGLSRGQIETAGGISLGFFGQDYGATASEEEVANARILIEPDGRLTGGGGGRIDALEILNGPSQAGADKTDNAIRTIIPQFPMIEIKQFEEGNQGSRLITHFIRRGGATISGGTWSLGNKLLGAGSASINSSNGLVTVSDINQSGSYEVIYTHTDTIQTRLVINVTYVAAPVNSGGGGGGGSNPPETVLSISNTPSVVDWLQGSTSTVSVSHTAREDGVALSGGTWSIQSSSGGSVTINTNGVATVTSVNRSGFYTVRYTLSGGARVVSKSINIQFYPNDNSSPTNFE